MSKKRGNKKKKIFKKNILSIFAVVIAAIAIIVTWNGNSIAKSGNELAETVYYENSIPAWTGEISTDNDIMVLGCLNDDIFLQSATLYFPDCISCEWEVEQLEYKFVLEILKPEIHAYIDNIVKPQKGYSYVASGLNLPIIIDSTYTKGGVVMKDTSLYNLSFNYFNLEENLLSTDLLFTGLSLVRHLGSNENVLTVVNKEWSTVNRQLYENLYIADTIEVEER